MVKLKRHCLHAFALVVVATGLDAADINNEFAPDLARGEDIYFTVCEACHGDTGQGGTGGGAPLTDALTLEQIMNVLKYGQNTMPEFGSVYAEKDLRDVATFVLEVLIKE